MRNRESDRGGEIKERGELGALQKRKRHLKLAGHWWLIFRSLSLEWRKRSKREEQREQDGERVKGERERERQGEKDEEKGRGEGEPAQPKPSLCLCEPGKSASEVVIDRKSVV